MSDTERYLRAASFVADYIPTDKLGEVAAALGRLSVAASVAHETRPTDPSRPQYGVDRDRLDFLARIFNLLGRTVTLEELTRTGGTRS